MLSVLTIMTTDHPRTEDDSRAANPPFDPLLHSPSDLSSDSSSPGILAESSPSDRPLVDRVCRAGSA